MHPLLTEVLEDSGLSASGRLLFTIYDSLFKSLPAAVALLDGGGRVMALNTEWSRIVGPGFSDQRAANPHHSYADTAASLGIWGQEQASRINGAIQDIVQRRRDAFDDELPVIIGGKESWHRVNLVPLDRDKFDGVVAMHVDVSDQRQMRDEMERFIYIAAHDLQEPLRNIASYVQLLARRYRDRLDEDATLYIDFAVDGAKRMSQLIRDLLSYSRLSRGRPAEHVNLAACLAEVLHSIESTLQATGTELQVGPLPSVKGDSVQLASVFQNLISNSIKYRHPDRPPRIAISAERKDTVWHISVSDNGIGFAPEYDEKVFDIFERLDPQDGLGGTGIGLAIVKRTIEKLGGRIWVDAREGEGATFHFTLPAD